MALLRSETIGDLMAALAKAQGEFIVIKKDTKNYYGGKYAQLDAIVDAVRPALSKNGIAFFHDVGSDLEQRTASVTTYLQLGEQWIGIFAEASAVDHRWDKTLQEQVERFDTQTISIVWTYFKRTQLQAITGVAAEEDTDAQELVGNNPSIPKKTTPAQALATKPQPVQPQNAPQQTQPPQERARATAAQTQEDQGIFKSMPDNLLTCIVKAVWDKDAKGKAYVAKNGNAYRVVTLNGYLKVGDGSNNFAYCYDSKLFAALQAGVGKEVQLKLKPLKDGDTFVHIADVFYVDGVEYVEGVPANSEEIAPPAEGGNS